MASKRVGDIYKITVDKDFYIGSTWHFNHRLALHKNYSKTDNRKLYKAIRDNNNEFEMTLLYEYECYTDEELRMEERKCYDEMKPTLNMYRPYISEEEKIEYIKKHKKQYYIKNKDNIMIYKKQWRDKNKYICGCGSRVLNENSHVKKHEQCKKHKNYLLQM